MTSTACSLYSIRTWCSDPDVDAVRMGSFAETRGVSAVAQSMRGGAEAARLALVGGMPGIAWTPGGRIRGAVALEIVDGRIVEIDVIGNPERLEQLDVLLLDISARRIADLPSVIETVSKKQPTWR